ncbi:hypothetical protein Taro_029640 [Colocasia esculenta]|uniref:Uncharacterized protein n=1 Tax=Colocasia esculenta TaxID=4460 RepID=A0A843W0V4_COLES|nr:hypothetical protein [Colocasia esculenta]
MTPPWIPHQISNIDFFIATELRLHKGKPLLLLRSEKFGAVAPKLPAMTGAAMDSGGKVSGGLKRKEKRRKPQEILREGGGRFKFAEG